MRQARGYVDPVSVLSSVRRPYAAVNSGLKRLRSGPGGESSPRRGEPAVGGTAGQMQCRRGLAEGHASE